MYIPEPRRPLLCSNSTQYNTKDFTNPSADCRVIEVSIPPDYIAIPACIPVGASTPKRCAESDLDLSDISNGLHGHYGDPSTDYSPTEESIDEMITECTEGDISDGMVSRYSTSIYQ